MILSMSYSILQGICVTMQKSAFFTYFAGRSEILTSGHSIDFKGKLFEVNSHDALQR